MLDTIAQVRASIMSGQG